MVNINVTDHINRRYDEVSGEFSIILATTLDDEMETTTNIQLNGEGSAAHIIGSINAFVDIVAQELKEFILEGVLLRSAIQSVFDEAIELAFADEKEN